MLTVRERRDGKFHFSIDRESGGTGGDRGSSSEDGPPGGSLTAESATAGGLAECRIAGGRP
jgi:hypothetical protein